MTGEPEFTDGGLNHTQGGPAVHDVYLRGCSKGI